MQVSRRGEEGEEEGETKEGRKGKRERRERKKDGWHMLQCGIWRKHSAAIPSRGLGK